MIRPAYTVEVKDLMQLMGESIEQGMSVAQLLDELDLPTTYLDDPEGTS